MPTADAGFTTLIIERVIDTDPLNLVVSYSEQVELDGGASVDTGTLPPFRGTVQRRADVPVQVDIGPGEGPAERSDEYVLVASRTADLGEVSPERVLTFTHPAYGKLRITNVHAYRVRSETCGYACRLAQIR